MSKPSEIPEREREQLIFLLCIWSPGCGEGTRTTDQYETRNGDGAENFGKGHSWEARHHDIATATARGDQGNQPGDVPETAGRPSNVNLFLYF